LLSKVLRARDSPGGLAAFQPTTSVDLYPLGLILVEILHSEFRPVYDNEEDALARLSGRVKPLVPESALTDLRQSLRDVVMALLEEIPGNRQSAATVIKAPIFSIGMHTQLNFIKEGQAEVKAGQEKIREDIAEVLSFSAP